MSVAAHCSVVHSDLPPSHLSILSSIGAGHVLHVRQISWDDFIRFNWESRKRLREAMSRKKLGQTTPWMMDGLYLPLGGCIGLWRATNLGQKESSLIMTSMGLVTSPSPDSWPVWHESRRFLHLPSWIMMWATIYTTYHWRGRRLEPISGDISLVSNI